MKIIPKWQKGGDFMSLFADYLSIDLSLPQQKTTNTKSDDSDKGKLTEKDLFTLLKDVDGLPNEMLHLVSNIKAMYQQVSLFGDDGMDSASLANIYAQNIYELKHANFNKKEYDKAYSQVKTNEGLNEYAISTSGLLIAYDLDNQLTLVSVQEFMNNPQEYKPITNSNLLWLRAHDPNFVNNNQIFDVISNGIGINKVELLIRQRFNSLGTEEIQQEGYKAGLSSNVIEGFKVLKEAQNAGEDIALLVKEKRISKSQANQAQQALAYIYSTLPENAKAILQLHSGNKNNPQEGALQIIGTMIASRTSNFESISLDIDSGKANGEGKAKGTSGNTLDNEKLTVASQFLQGKGLREIFNINAGTNYTMTVSSNAMQLTKANGDQLGANCTLQEVTQGQYGPILDLQKATMGGYRIDPSNFNTIIIDDGMVRSIDFPVNADGMPDLRPTTIEKKRQFDLKLLERGIDLNDQSSVAANYEEINMLLQECELPAAYNSEGKLIAGQWGRFAVMHATAPNKSLGLDDLDVAGPFLQEVTNDAIIDNLLSILLEKTDQDKIEWDRNDSWIEGSYDAFLKGTLFIPVYENYFLSQNAPMTPGVTEELDTRQLILDRQNELKQRWVNPGQL